MAKQKGTITKTPKQLYTYCGCNNPFDETFQERAVRWFERQLRERGYVPFNTKAEMTLRGKGKEWIVVSTCVYMGRKWCQDNEAVKRLKESYRALA